MKSSAHFISTKSSNEHELQLVTNFLLITVD